MKKISLYTSLLLISFIGFSQEENDLSNEKSFGLGTKIIDNIGNFSAYGFDGRIQTIYFTIDLNDKIRIEPELAFSLNSGANYFEYGLGLFGKKPITKFNFLYGLRFGGNTEESGYFAPTIGGECFIIDNFSIGSEIQVMSIVRRGDSVTFTSTELVARFYFNK